MHRPTWHELDRQREALPKRLSRAELARRAGLSESTIQKGIREGRTPQKDVQERVELVLDAAQKAAEAGL